MPKLKVVKGLIKAHMKFQGFYAWTSFWNTIYFANEQLMDNEKYRTTRKLSGQEV